MEMEKEKKKKESAVVFYPSPGRAHINSVVELSKLILKHHPNSLSVTIITSSFPSESPSLHSYASEISSKYSINFIHLEAAPPLIPGNDDDANNNNFASDPVRSAREFIGTLFEIPKLTNPALRDTLLGLSHAYNIRAFVMDYFCHFAFHVPSGLGLPTYYFTSMGAFVAGIIFTIPHIDKTISGSLKDLDPNFLVEFPGAPPIPGKDIMVLITDRAHRVYGYMLEAAVALAKSEGFILNTFEAFERRVLDTITKAPPVYCVGPLVTPYEKEDEKGCITWLDSHPSGSVLFLCFGRFGTFSSRQLHEIAVGLERSGVRFLWVVRNPPEIGTDEVVELESLLHQGFLERTKERGLVVRKWAPQFQVLNHGSVGGFVTHCGWNSVMEAVYAGVPMLTWPLYAEQQMNSVYLVEGLQMALGLRKEEDGSVSSGELEEKVAELMSSEMGKDLRERAALMKEAAAEALSDGGSSKIAITKLVNGC